MFLTEDKAEVQPGLKGGFCLTNSLTTSKELKEKEEYVDDIHVEADRSEHVLLWVQRVPSVANQQLHIERQKLKGDKKDTITFSF